MHSSTYECDRRKIVSKCRTEPHLSFLLELFDRSHHARLVTLERQYHEWVCTGHRGDISHNNNNRTVKKKNSLEKDTLKRCVSTHMHNTFKNVVGTEQLLSRSFHVTER